MIKLDMKINSVDLSEKGDYLMLNSGNKLVFLDTKSQKVE